MINPDPIIMKQMFSMAAQASTLTWEPFRAGIEIVRLYGNQEAGPSAALLRYQPGASVPRHVHSGYEHVMILAGSQADRTGEHFAGTMIVNPPGSWHSVLSPEGCIALVIWEGPVHFGVPRLNGAGAQLVGSPAAGPAAGADSPAQ